MISNLFLIAVIVVIIVDLSGFIDTLKHGIWKLAWKNKPYQDFPFKPFSCSFCCTWWCCLIYIIATSNFTIPYICLCLVLAFFTSTIKDILIFIKDFGIKIMDELYTYFNL